jgi:hypothetical protein
MTGNETFAAQRRTRRAQAGAIEPGRRFAYPETDATPWLALPKASRRRSTQ